MTTLVVVTGLAVIYKLVKMNREKPDIDNQQVVDQIKERMPSIIMILAFFVFIQFCFLVLYSVQRGMNIASLIKSTKRQSFEI